MSTQFTNRQWRLPNNENKAKQSNYSMSFLTTTRIPNITGLGLGTSVDTFSISSWFYKSNMNYAILFSAYSGSGSYFNTGVSIELNTDGTIMFFNGGGRTTTSSQYSINTWYNLVVTSDGTTVKMYVNGSQVTLGSTTAQARDFTNVWINSGSYSSSNFGIIGKLDAVSIFDYALSQSQVTTLYGSSSTGIGNPMSLNPKPVAYYPLGDQDAFNGSNYLVPNSSLKDYVFDFNPSNSNYIDCGDSDDLSFGDGTNDSPFSLSVWVNMDDATKFRILNKAQNLGAAYTKEYAFSTGGDDKIFFYLYQDNISTTRIGQKYNGAALTSYEGQWIHLVGTYDGSSSANGIKIYLNGIQVDDTPVTGAYTAMQNTNQPFVIGKLSSDFANGKISNAQIFNTALPATDVETLYNNGSPLTSMSGFTSLQGWWKLDASATYDGTDWTIPDDSSNSNDGTSSGMTQANLVQSDLSFTSGYSPYALEFDSAGPDEVKTGVVSISGNYSISGWFKWNNSITYHYLWDFRDQSASNPALYLVNNALYLYINGTVFSSSSITQDGNTWYNIILVKSGNTYTAYKNGSSLASGTNSNSFANSEMTIGNRSTSVGTTGLDGSISNVSIWNTDLTPAQVTEIYSEGIPQNLNNHSAVSSLVSWWQLGTNSSFNTNWTVLDEKGSNNGTSVNMGEDSIVDGVNTYGGGTSSGMGGDEVVGDAPYSSSNALSVNMDVEDRVTDTPS